MANFLNEFPIIVQSRSNIASYWIYLQNDSNLYQNQKWYQILKLWDIFGWSKFIASYEDTRWGLVSSYEDTLLWYEDVTKSDSQALNTSCNIGNLTGYTLLSMFATTSRRVACPLILMACLGHASKCGSQTRQRVNTFPGQQYIFIVLCYCVFFRLILESCRYLLPTRIEFHFSLCISLALVSGLPIIIVTCLPLFNMF